MVIISLHCSEMGTVFIVKTAFYMKSGLEFPNQSTFFVMKAGSDWCKLPLKTTEEGEKEIQEETVSPSVAKEISGNAAVWSV